jgi:hypothetical protein
MMMSGCQPSSALRNSLSSSTRRHAQPRPAALMWYTAISASAGTSSTIRIRSSVRTSFPPSSVDEPLLGPHRRARRESALTNPARCLASSTENRTPLAKGARRDPRCSHGVISRRTGARSGSVSCVGLACCPQVARRLTDPV